MDSQTTAYTSTSAVWFSQVCHCNSFSICFEAGTTAAECSTAEERLPGTVWLHASTPFLATCRLERSCAARLSRSWQHVAWNAGASRVDVVPGNMLPGMARQCSAGAFQAACCQERRERMKPHRSWRTFFCCKRFCRRGLYSAASVAFCFARASSIFCCARFAFWSTRFALCCTRPVFRWTGLPTAAREPAFCCARP